MCQLADSHFLQTMLSSLRKPLPSSAGKQDAAIKAEAAGAAAQSLAGLCAGLAAAGLTDEWIWTLVGQVIKHIPESSLDAR